MLTPSAIILGIAAIATVVLATVVLYRQPGQAINRHFFAFTVSVVGWTISNALFIKEVSEGVRFAVALASYGFAAILALYFFLFCNDLATKRYPNGVIYAAYIAGVGAAVLSVLPGVVAHGIDELTIKTHIIGLLMYATVLFAFFGAGLWLLVRAVFTTHNRGARYRIGIVLAGLTISAAIGLGCNLILPLFGSYAFVQYGPLGSLVLVATSAYAIVRHGLFDIRLAISRTLSYILTLGLLAGVYAVMVAIASRWLFPSDASSQLGLLNIIPVLLLTLLFQPIKLFFDRVTNSIFFKGGYSREAFYASLSSVLAETTDLTRLLRRAAGVIGGTLSSEQVFFSLQQDSRMLNVGDKGRTKLVGADYDTLRSWFEASASALLLRDELPEDETSSQLARLLRSYGVMIVLPLRKSDKVTGLLCLGDRKSGAYTRRDVKVLETIADELVVAIQNALSIQEIQVLNETLQQRIDEATSELRRSNAQLRKLDEAKDEFISMASHQLRTPLTSVKGYIDMMLEGDAGEITDMQRKFLSEAYVSSERMVHLINDFLNVSRLQTGKFVIDKRPVDLARLVGEELDGLKINAAGRHLSFSYTPPKDIPLLMLDEAKVRQVVMNFADNALYYSESDTVIRVALTKEGNEVRLTVKDTGIGVPEGEQEQLFTKFYRASNARKQRPDGTGVGLFLAKRVIVAHGGHVIFESKEGQGSTFGFSLPLQKLLVSDAVDAPASAR